MAGQDYRHPGGDWWHQSGARRFKGWTDRVSGRSSVCLNFTWARIAGPADAASLRLEFGPRIGAQQTERAGTGQSEDRRAPRADLMNRLLK